MLIYPAIDLYEGRAVRLFKGDYNKMTIYSGRPAELAAGFRNAGAERLHLVDLEGARTGETPNLETVKSIVRESGLFAEVGGGIRSLKTAETYLNSGIGRVILGTAAVKDPKFLAEAAAEFGEKVAVGIDLADGFVAIRGWTERTRLTAEEFCSQMEQLGIKTVICTDISRDGALKGANIGLYAELSRRYSLDLIASGGVSTLEDVRRLRELGLHGAIVGKALYEGALDLKECIEAAK